MLGLISFFLLPFIYSHEILHHPLNTFDDEYLFELNEF